ncbi:hypothetical protein [Rhodococcus sp. (in: high G+C Gram-positive bacteria)]|uniref:TPR repeat region-containing protein n=1 Tax=Rhodococcus sp. TaxID=1831 RepID=UPI003BB68A0F
MTPALLIRKATLHAAALSYTGRITQCLADIGTADANAATAVADAFAEVRRDSGVEPSRFTGYENLATADGTADGAALRQGTWGPDDYGRVGDIISAIQLSPDQLEALARGETVVRVPPMALDYLRDFYREAGTDGLLNAVDVLRGREADGDSRAASHIDALANGLLMVSNENVGAGTTTGGMEHLPGNLAEQLNRVAYGPDDPGQSLADIHNAAAGRLPEFARFIGEANPGFVPGAEFSETLVRASSRIADLAPVDGDYPTDAYSQFEFGPIAEACVDIGGRNEDAAYHVLTAPDNARVLMPLFEHEWSDDGAGVGQLVEWIAEDAVVTDPTDTTRADRAGEASYALSQVLSSSGSESTLGFLDEPNKNPYDRLMNIPGVGDGKSSLGEVNPALTQAMAGAFSPYVVDMVTDNRMLSMTSNFGQLGPVEATRLFSLLSSDPSAGMVINGSALAAAHEIDQGFARNPDSTMLGETSGRLRAVVEGGLDAELGDRINDQSESKSERADRRAAYFGASQAAIATGIGFVAPPWGAVASGGVYVGGAFLASDFIDANGKLTEEFAESPEAKLRLSNGIVSTDTSETTLPTSMSQNEIRYNILTTLVEERPERFSDITPEVLRGRSMLSYAELRDLNTKNDSYADRIEYENHNVRHEVLENSDQYLQRSGVTRAGEYLEQHEFAYNGYDDAIFGHASVAEAFNSIIRGNGEVEKMSGWAG